MKPESIDAIWAIRYYLGREPKDEAEVTDLLSRATTERAMRREIYISPERTHRGFVSPMPAHFCIYRPGAKRIVVIGNCQGPEIARAVAAITDCSVLGLEVMDYHRNVELYDREIAQADHVISCVLSDEWKTVSTQALREKQLKSFATYTPLFFDGLHPDIHYWGPPTSRAASAVGDYHSGIVLKSYFSGESPEKCVARFNHTEFFRLGYYEKVKPSLAELDERDADADVKITDFIRENFREKSLFLSFNHPNAELIMEVAIRTCKHLGIDIASSQPDTVYNHQVTNIIWPVYAQVAKYHGVKFQPTQLFWVKGVAMTLEEYVWRSYLVYNMFGREKFYNQASDEQRSAISV